MINQFKFTCYMFQAMTEKGGKDGGYAGSSKDDAPKATTTQQKQNE